MFLFLFATYIWFKPMKIWNKKFVFKIMVIYYSFNFILKIKSYFTNMFNFKTIIILTFLFLSHIINNYLTILDLKSYVSFNFFHFLSIKWFLLTLVPLDMYMIVSSQYNYSISLIFVVTDISRPKIIIFFNLSLLFK